MMRSCHEKRSSANNARTNWWFTSSKKKATAARRSASAARSSLKPRAKVSAKYDFAAARMISVDVISDEGRDLRTAAAALRATCFRTSLAEQRQRDEAARRDYFEKLVEDELQKDALLPAHAERIALVVPRSTFISQSSLSSSSSSSFEIEEEYLVAPRIVNERGEEAQRQDQDEDTVMVATLDYVIADKLQGELLYGDKGNGQAFDSEKYAFNEATQTYEFMPKPIERAYCFNVCVLPRYRGGGFAHRLIREAVRRVALNSVRFLYVHVELNNAPALRCYESFGFLEEKKESEWVAVNFGRPPRKLLFVSVAPVAEACK